MTEDVALYYFTMILLGLVYLHFKEIIHRDLKPENILIHKLKGIDVIKIGDFGISKSGLSSLRTEETLNGKTSTAYIAPEILNALPSTLKVDMWALGIILY